MTVVVEVEARLAGLDRGLREGQRKLDRFAAAAEQMSARVDRAFAKPGKGRSAADALLGDVRALRAQSDALLVDAQRVDAAGATAGVGLGRLAVGGAVAGVAVNALGRNMQELGGDAAKLGGALSDLTSFNVVGFFKGLQSVGATDLGKTTADLVKYGDAARATAKANEYAARGWDKSAAAARLAATQIRAVTDALSDPTLIRDPIRGGALDAMVSGVPLPRPAAGLPQNLQTALAGARAAPGAADDIAQIKRAREVLKKQLGQAGLKDAGREDIYTAISSLNTELESLTKVAKPPAAKPLPIVPVALEIGLASAELTATLKDDLEKLRGVEGYLERIIKSETDSNRKLSELQRLGQVRAQIASTLGNETPLKDGLARLDPLGQGPVLTGKPFEFAQQFGFKPKASDYLADLQGQNKQQGKANTAFKKISGLGASDNLVNELRTGGDAGAQQAIALAAGDKGTVKQYNQAYGVREKQAEQLVKAMNVQASTVTIRAGNVHVSGGGKGKGKFDSSGLAGAR